MGTGSRALLLAVFAVILALLGAHSLEDPDLGWHLAGGLRMLEKGAVPFQDPLGAEGSHWVAYSWIPELLFAAVYRIGGFRALQLLQTLLVIGAGMSVLRLFLASLHAGRGGASREIDLIAGMLACLFSLLFLAPVFHLRPQLLSIIFFATLLRWLIEDRLAFVRLLPLAVLWANTHVFWVFAPVAILVFAFFRRNQKTGVRFAAAALAAGLVSPYGTDNIRVVYQYGFSHHEAYRLIDEFAPLGPDLGFLFAVYAGSLLALCLFVRRSGAADRQGAPAFFFAALFGIAAAIQRKYLPFYGVFVGMVFARELARRLPFSGSGDVLPWRQREALSAGVLISVVIAAAFFAGAEAPLPKDTEDLLSLARDVNRESQPSGEPQIVFNGFDDGGWIALAFHESSRNVALKTAIDGRTLVMGQIRLLEYAEAVQGRSSVCLLADRWQTSMAILRRSSVLYRGLTSERSTCRDQWRLLKEQGPFAALLRDHRR